MADTNSKQWTTVTLPSDNPSPQHLYAILHTLKTNKNPTFTLEESKIEISRYDLLQNLVDVLSKSEEVAGHILGLYPDWLKSTTENELLGKAIAGIDAFWETLKNPNQLSNPPIDWTREHNTLSRIKMDELVANYKAELMAQAAASDKTENYHVNVANISLKEMIARAQAYYAQYGDPLLEKLDPLIPAHASEAEKVKVLHQGEELTTTVIELMGQRVAAQPDQPIDIPTILEEITTNPNFNLLLNRGNLEKIAKYIEQTNHQLLQPASAPNAPTYKQKFLQDFVRMRSVQQQLAPSYSSIVDSYQSLTNLDRTAARQAATAFVKRLQTGTKNYKDAFVLALADSGKTDAIPALQNAIKADPLQAGNVFLNLKAYARYGEVSQLKTSGGQRVHLTSLTPANGLPTQSFESLAEQLNRFVEPGLEVGPAELELQALGGTQLVSGLKAVELQRLKALGLADPVTVQIFHAHYDQLAFRQTYVQSVIRSVSTQAPDLHLEAYFDTTRTLTQAPEIIQTAYHHLGFFTDPGRLISRTDVITSVADLAGSGTTLGVQIIDSGFSGSLFTSETPFLTNLLLNNRLMAGVTTRVVGWAAEAAAGTGFKSLMGKGILLGAQKLGLAIPASLIPGGQILGAVLAIDSAIEFAKAIPLIGKFIEALPIVQGWTALKEGGGKILKYGLYGLGGAIVGLGGLGAGLLAMAGSFFTFGSIGGVIGGAIGGVPGALIGFGTGGWFGPGLAKGLNGFLKGGWGNLGNSLSNGLQSLLNSISGAGSGYTAAPYIALSTVAGGSILTMQVLISAFALPPFEKVNEVYTPLRNLEELEPGMPMCWPTEGSVTAGNNVFTTGDEASHKHNNAIDIGSLGGANGQLVYATHDGVVSQSGEHLGPSGTPDGFGVSVTVQSAPGQNPPFSTLYAHLLEGSNVADGTAVKRGDPIGRMNSTGNSTGAHLHYQLLGADYTITDTILLAGCITPEQAGTIERGCLNANGCSIIINKTVKDL